MLHKDKGAKLCVGLKNR